MATNVKIVNHGKVSTIGCCAILVFNLFAIALANSKCATLYSSFSYQGGPLSLADGSRQPNLRHMNYMPKSVKITPGCFLTIFDIYGNKQSLDRDSNNLGWFANRVLDATCCECGGCNDVANTLDGGMCARLFEHARCDSCSGYRLDLKTGDQAKRFGPINNRMTSIAVRQGCTLTVFYEQDFGGWRFNFTHSNNMMGTNWYKQISSAKCGCESVDSERYESLPVTYPTTTRRPIITLPTVPTTTRRPLITLPTVPTTTRRPLITLPTVPTTTKRPLIITLPTVPTTVESKLDSSEDYSWFGEEKDSDIKDSGSGSDPSWPKTTVQTTTQRPSPTTTTTTQRPSTTTTTKTTTTTTTEEPTDDGWGFEDENVENSIEPDDIDDDLETEEEEEEEEEWDDW